MVTYKLFAERKYDAEYGYYQAYGIRAEASGDILRDIGDISDDREKVAALVGLYNDCRLSPEHLDEMIEDFLYDFEV